MDNLKIYFVTYNVGTSEPETEELEELLTLHETMSEKSLPDIYVISLQEVSARPTSMLMSALFDDPWTNSFCFNLAKHGYVKLKSIRLQGMVLDMFCLKKHILNIREVETEYTRTGLSGMWGNKGAVSMRINAYGCSVCFVNAHLTAHDEGLNDRVEDYNSIIKDQKFHVAEHTEIFFHDYVFWMGDLNFRLVEEFQKGPEDIERLIKKGDLDYLFDHDQLRSVMAEGRAFSELIENKPEFAPTFKFEVGSVDYDFKRRPAWTDRILYKVNSNNYENITLKAEQKSYKAHMNYTLSDHKPVTAEFVIKIPEISLLDSTKDVSIQVFTDTSEHAVQFEKMPYWIRNEENLVAYKVNEDVPKYKDDWIGVFSSNFDSLDNYIIYEYANKTSSPLPVAKNPHHSDDSLPQKFRYSLQFSEDVNWSNITHIRLIYFSVNEDKVQSVLGVSEPILLTKSE